MSKLFIDEFLTLNLKKIQKTSPMRVVFPEGNNQKIQAVAQQIIVAFEGKIIPILVFSDKDEIPESISKVKGIKKIRVSEFDFSDFLFKIFSKRYQGRKEIFLSECRDLSFQRNYFSTLFLKKKYADCLVGGITYSSRKIISPALQIIGTEKPQQDTRAIVSSSILLEGKNGERFLVSDPALFSKDPTVSELFEIGKNAYFLSDVFGFKTKKMVFLSYSTFNVLKQKGSGTGKKVKIIREAVELMKEQNFTNLIVSGEMQFDAAWDEKVRFKKAGSLLFRGKPNIFIFPDLNSANICYKVIQRIGNYDVVGPIIWGLKQQVSDLSRGATSKEIYRTVLLTVWAEILKRKGKNFETV